MKNYCVHLENEAVDWENATPLGNGSMGAMLYGTVATEQIQINEESIWSGKKPHKEDLQLKDKIKYIRGLLMEGKPLEADAWAQENTKNSFGRIGSYETAGEIYAEIHPKGTKFTDYNRDLFLNKGIAAVSYRADGILYKREAFASYTDKLIAVKFTCEKKNSLNARVFYERMAEFDDRTVKECKEPLNFFGQKNCINVTELKAENNSVSACGVTVRGNHHFCVKIKVKAENGRVYEKDNSVCVENADSFCLFISIAAEFKEKDYIKACERNLNGAKDGFEALKARHAADFSALMARSEITLGSKSDLYLEKIPIKERLERIRNGETDIKLAELYFAFGKYLFISSSRRGTLPSNLQGVWNNKLFAIWNSDYHTNINIQMNYWLAEPANLSDCAFPLFDYINKYLLEQGKDTAKRIYGCRGTVVHHLSDIYGFTDPADGLWGLWPLGGAWLAFHLYEHYLFTSDKDFLENTAYDYISECTKFFLDFMTEDSYGNLLSGPSTSPENKYYINKKTGETASLCMSPSMDIEIIGGLFRIFSQSAKVLNRDCELNERVKKAILKMPTLKVGKYGQLMEWMQDYEEPELGHRHISHLFALHPDNAITEDKTPELFKAAGISLERRLSGGGGHTGWSRAWLINQFARLKDGEKAFENINLLLARSTNDNLFDTHPPFQIDGNFGASAGILEMLIQSHENRIVLLPAIPKCFKDGEFRNLCARGGITVSAAWENGKIIRLKLKSDFDTESAVEFPDKTIKEFRLKAGVPAALDYK